MAVSFRPRLHEQIKPPLIALILDPYEVTLDEYAQIKLVLFAHVNAALGSVHMDEKICQITWFSGKLSRFGMQICRICGLFCSCVRGRRTKQDFKFEEETSLEKHEHNYWFPRFSLTFF